MSVSPLQNSSKPSPVPRARPRSYLDVPGTRPRGRAQRPGSRSWNGADSLAKEVGGNGGFPDAPLEITAPGQESGTYDAFIELSGITDIATEQGLSEDQAATLRPDYESSPDDNVIIQAMEGSASSLGFTGFAYAEGAADQIKVIQVDEGSGCIEPTRDTIADGSYPLSRTLYIYVNKEKITSNPALKAFVDSMCPMTV